MASSAKMTRMERVKKSFEFLKFGRTSQKPIQDFVLGAFESAFSRIGLLIARFPFPVILFCFIVTGCCGIGLMRIKKENNVVKLWISETSHARLEHIVCGFCKIIFLTDKRASPFTLCKENHCCMSLNSWFKFS